MLFRSAHAPTGGAAHARPRAAPHAALPEDRKRVATSHTALKQPARGPDTEWVRQGDDGGSRSTDRPEVALGAHGTALPWWANRHLRLGLLLAGLLAAVLALLGTRGSWFGLDGAATAQAGLPAIPADCPGHDAPAPRTVAAGELGALGRPLAAIMPARVGRIYESGSIATGELWSDDTPQRLPSGGDAPTPAGYEIRWWALDREGAEDDVAADALEYSSAGQAEQALRLAASPRCRRDGASSAPRYPGGARELTWVNPDDAREWDVLFARGPRLYRVTDVPPEYLLTTTGPRQDRRERLRDGATPEALACALPGAGCPHGAGSLGASSLAPLPRSPRAAALGPPPSATAAAAYGHAVNLRGYLLPGASAIAPEAPAVDRGYWQVFARCSGPAGSPGVLASIRSPLFRTRRADRYNLVYSVVYSAVLVFPGDVPAARYLTALASPRARDCLAGSFRRLARRLASKSAAPSGDRVRLGHIAATAPATPTPRSYRGGAPYRATALRLSMQATYRTRRGRLVQVPFYLEDFLFADGPAVVELVSQSLWHPAWRAEERFLEASLVGRAEAHEAEL